MLSFFVSKWYVVDFTLQVVTSKTTRSNRKVVNKANPFSLGHGSVAQTQMLAAIIRYIKVAGVRGEDGRLMSAHWAAADGTVGNPLQRQADGWWINATLISIASASGVPEGVRISSKSNHNAAATRAAITNVSSMNWSANSRIPSPRLLLLLLMLLLLRVLLPLMLRLLMLLLILLLFVLLMLILLLKLLPILLLGLLLLLMLLLVLLQLMLLLMLLLLMLLLLMLRGYDCCFCCCYCLHGWVWDFSLWLHEASLYLHLAPPEGKLQPPPQEFHRFACLGSESESNRPMCIELRDLIVWRRDTARREP